MICCHVARSLTVCASRSPPHNCQSGGLRLTVDLFGATRLRTLSMHCPMSPVTQHPNFPLRAVDNTLSFLCTSAVARGLPHQVTRNLHLITIKNATILNPPPFLLGGGSWDGQAPPDHPKYQPAKGPLRKQKPAQKEKDRLANASLCALGELVRMAEGRSGLSLGRMQRGR